MDSTTPDFEVLDLGLVYYKKMINDPQIIIDTVNDVDKRFSLNEHNDSFTEVRSWVDWSDNKQTFCYQKFFPKTENINPSDYYYKEQNGVSKALYDALDRATDHYTKVLYPFAEKNIKNREYSVHLLKYTEGGFLPAHQDHGVSSRVLSAVLYLNDDYEGGEIEFVNSGVRMKPEAGSIIIFPSNFLYIHQVHPIVSGERYSLPHWYHNMKSMIHSTGQE